MGNTSQKSDWVLDTDDASTTQPTTPARSTSAESDWVPDTDADTSKKMGWGEYLGRGATEAIPIAGGIAGGMAGSWAGPLGAVGGSGLGYAEGSEARDLLNKYIFGDKASNNAPMEAVKRVAKNMGSGAVQEVGGQLFGSALGKLGEMLPKWAEKAAISHLRPTPSLSRQLGKEGLHSAAREALDAGAIKPFSKAQKSLENLEDILSQLGKEKGDMVLASGERLDPEVVAGRIEKEVIKPLRTQSSETQPIADALQTKVDKFREFHNTPEVQAAGEGVPVSRIEQEKMDAMRNTKYGENTDLANAAHKNYNRVLKEEVENAIDDPAFNAIKKKFGNLTNAHDMANRTASLTNGGTGLLGHIGDKSIQTAALLKPDPAHLALALARILTKGRMGSTAATGLNAAGKGIQTLTTPTSGVWQNAIGRYLNNGGKQ